MGHEADRSSLIHGSLHSLSIYHHGLVFNWLSTKKTLLTFFFPPPPHPKKDRGHLEELCVNNNNNIEILEGVDWTHLAQDMDNL
jgi:hypothetical protein